MKMRWLKINVKSKMVKWKKYGVTLNACYKAIEQLMEEDVIHQYGLGVYVVLNDKFSTKFWKTIFET